MNEALMNIQAIQASGVVLPTDGAAKAASMNQLPDIGQAKTMAFTDILNQAAHNVQNVHGVQFNADTQTQGVLAQQFNTLNQLMQKGDSLALQVASGQTDNLHEVMIQMEEVKMAFQLAVQVKNRLLEAYQEMMRMQV